MKKVLFVILECIIRLVFGLIFSVLFFRGYTQGSQSYGLEVGSLIFFSIFSCLIENLLVVGVNFFTKYSFKEFNIVLTITLFISFGYFVLFIVKSTSSNKWADFLFVTFMLFIGFCLKFLILIINESNYEDRG